MAMRTIYEPPQAVISRAEAKASGLKRYYTGKPCKHGHVTWRQTNDGACCICAQERTRRWRGENTAAVIEYSRRYYAENRERCRASQRMTYEKYGDERRAYSRAWRLENIERVRVNQAKRRAWKKGSSESHTLDDVLRIGAAQKWRCAICGKKLSGKGYHVDHIVPLKLGGSNGPRNLQVLCPPCNRQKQAKDPIKHMRDLGRLL